jgi:Taurine catabolism dioxygenase TauD, TfdA family
MAGADFHTDRSSMTVPPNVILIYCAALADEGGETILADIAAVYDVLHGRNDATLAALFTPCSAYFGVAPGYVNWAILNRQRNGWVFVRFRSDALGYIHLT